jgi:dihydropteroate synthase
MGIVNCTPDSFSDGGAFVGEEEIARRVWQVAEEGADIVDIGGESTRPGSLPVDAEEEWRRIEPGLRAAQREGYPLAVSVDTTKEEIARRALAEGAVIINDVSGLRQAPGIAALAADTGAGLIVMHMKGSPRMMQEDPRYEDLTGEIGSFLRASVTKAAEVGVGPERVLVDPGIGFGKTVGHNLKLIRRLVDFSGIGAGIVIGTSRKSFLGKIADLPVDERLEASIASFVASVLGGAHMIRVHDVRAAVRAVRIADAILAA